MEKRLHKGIGKEISLLGFGCMRLPAVDPEKQDIDFDQAQALIDDAYAHGVNYFDTAYGYHGGQSELFLGKALKKYPRGSFFLADKMPAWMAKDKEDVDRIFQHQLEKCGVDYFDFYLCHSLNRSHWARLEELGIYEYLLEKKREGKIRQLGFSFHDKPELMEEILAAHDWDFAQIQLNYLDWEMQNAKRQYELLQEHGLPCIVMEPVRGGALATLCPQAETLLRGAQPEKSLASWALRFAASLPGVMTVLSGMSAPEQVRDNIATMNPFIPLTDADRDLLREAAGLYLKSKTVPCTACRYCMDCPAGVDIPLMFQIFNGFKMTENGEAARAAFAKAGEEKQASHCVRCGQCAQHCPQLIDIPRRLEEVRGLKEKLD